MFDSTMNQKVILWDREPQVLHPIKPSQETESIVHLSCYNCSRKKEINLRNVMHTAEKNSHKSHFQRLLRPQQHKMTLTCGHPYEGPLWYKKIHIKSWEKLPEVWRKSPNMKENGAEPYSLNLGCLMTSGNHKFPDGSSKSNSSLHCSLNMQSDALLQSVANTLTKGTSDWRNQTQMMILNTIHVNPEHSTELVIVLKQIEQVGSNSPMHGQWSKLSEFHGCYNITQILRNHE